MSPPDAPRPRALTRPPAPPSDLDDRVRDLEHGHNNLAERVVELLDESKKTNATLDVIAKGLEKVNTEREAEKARKKWWDNVTRAVLVGLVLALGGWIAHIAMVVQTAKLSP